MNIVLLHAEDGFEDLPQRNWDLIIDLGRGPRSSYQEWAQMSGASVVSLYDFAEGVSDLHRMRDLLAPGMGRVVDRRGLDWWDIASLHISDQLLELVLVVRLAKTLPENARLYSSRNGFLPQALARIAGFEVMRLPGARGRALRQLTAHYTKLLLQSDRSQLVQSALDKYDPKHRLRKLFSPAVRPSTEPFVLAPTAYVNVSRSAVAYAKRAADRDILLVYARKSGRLEQVPGNVRSMSLSPFFCQPDPKERDSLLAAWRDARPEIARSAPELEAAAATGILDRVPQMIRWGTGVRDAWNRVLDSHNIVSCFCADNSNANSRIPLILCKQRGIPSVACHHGALDFRMAFKRQHADRYLAKNEMEWNYLREVCGLASSAVTLQPLAPATTSPSASRASAQLRDWMVYFTEPYSLGGWRIDEIYAALLPQLARLAGEIGLQLIIKLHPFENVRHFRRLTKRWLSAEERTRTQIISNSFSPEQWARSRVAFAVESSVAIECEQRGIPIFLMGWLRNVSCGYLRQFQKFHIGQVVETPVGMSEIPKRLRELESQLSGETGCSELAHSLLAGPDLASAVGSQG